MALAQFVVRRSEPRFSVGPISRDYNVGPLSVQSNTRRRVPVCRGPSFNSRLSPAADVKASCPASERRSVREMWMSFRGYARTVLRGAYTRSTRPGKTVRRTHWRITGTQADRSSDLSVRVSAKLLPPVTCGTTSSLIYARDSRRRRENQEWCNVRNCSAALTVCLHGRHHPLMRSTSAQNTCCCLADAPSRSISRPTVFGTRQ